MLSEYPRGKCGRISTSIIIITNLTYMSHSQSVNGGMDTAGLVVLLGEGMFSHNLGNKEAYEEIFFLKAGVLPVM